MGAARPPYKGKEMTELAIDRVKIHQESGKTFLVADTTTRCVASDRARNRLYVAYYDSLTSDLYLATSVNQGDTWATERVWVAAGWTRAIVGGPHIHVHNGFVYLTYTVYDGVDDYRINIIENETTPGTWTLTNITPYSTVGIQYPDRFFRAAQLIDLWDATPGEYYLNLIWVGPVANSGSYIYRSATSGMVRNETTKTWGSPVVINTGNDTWYTPAPSYTNLNVARKNGDTRLWVVPPVYGGQAYASATPRPRSNAFGVTPSGWIQSDRDFSSYYISTTAGITTPWDDDFHIIWAGSPIATAGDYRQKYSSLHQHVQLDDANPYVCNNVDGTRDWVHCPTDVVQTHSYFSSLSYEGSTTHGKTLWYAFERLDIVGGKYELHLKKATSAQGVKFDESDWLPEIAPQWSGTEDDTWVWTPGHGLFDSKRPHLWYHPDPAEHMVAQGAMGVIDIDYGSNNTAVYFFKTPDLILHPQQGITLELSAHVQSYVRAKTHGDYFEDTSDGSSTSSVISATTGGFYGNLVGAYIRFSSGTQDGQIRKITANTDDTITVFPPFLAAPANSDAFSTIDRDTFNLAPVFENVYSTGSTVYQYAPVRYFNYSGSTLASVLWAPEVDEGTLLVAEGTVSDTLVDAVSLSYATTYEETTWLTGDSNPVVLWYRWANLGTPFYGNMGMSVDIDVTE